METAVGLLDRLRDGADPAAWQRLDDLYRPLIHRWILRDAGLRNDAEDVVQDVMSVLIRELPQFHRERTGSFRLWLRNITQNPVLAFRHKKRPQRPTGDGDGPLAPCAAPNRALSR